MDEAKIIEWLISLGLSLRESKLYYSLLQIPEATAADLQRMSGVPRTKIYEALENVVSNGYCSERIEGRKKFFRATNPNELQKILKARWDHEREQKLKVGAELFKKLDLIYKNCNADDTNMDMIEVIRSPEQTHLKFCTLLSETKREMHIFHRSPFTASTLEMQQEQEKLQYDMLDRGVTIHTLLMFEEIEVDRLLRVLAYPTSENDLVRVADYLPLKLKIFDRERVMFPLPFRNNDNFSNFSQVVIADKGLSEFCYMQFMHQWQQAMLPQQWLENYKNRS